MRRNIKNKIKKYLFKIPEELRKNYIELSNEKMLELENSIRKNFHTGWRRKDKFTPKAYEADLRAHLIGRLENDRRKIIPWLNDAKPIKNKYILEIGCGTGSSSIAIAEQGAKLIGIDLDANALKVAEDRKKLYNLDMQFHLLNATSAKNTFKSIEFDFIILFAAVEHMIHEERILALKDTWNMLKPGALWVVIDTPNRLWFFDEHTSALPFFHWLPDKLAFKYSKFSPRKEFSEIYREYSKELGLHFLRRGRGLSFHEFDLAIGDSKKLNVVSSKKQYEKYSWMKSKQIERRYKRILKNVYPGLHDGFYEKNLELIIMKK